MGKSANIQSIEALKEFRSSLIRYAEAINLAVAEADAELEWTLTALKSQWYPTWKKRVFAANEEVTAARLALKRRRIFERAVQGVPSSCVDEIKALRKAERKLELAERTFKRVQHWLQQLDKERNTFKGARQKIMELSEGRIPRAVAQLDQWVDSLEAYLQTAPPRLTPPVPAPSPPMTGPPPATTTVESPPGPAEEGQDTPDDGPVKEKRP